MTAKKVPFCTDEELLDELKKLGYNDISPDVLEIMKGDLSQLITKDTGQLFHSKRSVSGNEKESPINNDTTKYRYSQRQVHKAVRNQSESGKPLPSNVALEREKIYSDVLSSNGELLKATSFEKYKNTLKSYKSGNYRKHENSTVDNIEEKLSSENLHEPSSEIDYSEKLHGVTKEQYQSNRSETKSQKESYPDLKQSYPQRQIPRLQRTFSDTNKSSVSEVSVENRFSDMLSSSDDISRISAVNRYKNTFLSYKRNNYAKQQENLLPESNKNQESLSERNQNTTETEYQSTISSISLDPNKIKRKVLRHRDGKPVITEEFLDIPSIFNSSYPETRTLDNTKSFSSDDLSWKSNSSTGSISAISPDTSITPRSNFSLSSTRSLHSRLVNPRKKKNDPVAMYNYYKKFWNEFKPPGEKTHDKIRWAVRDKMLDYNL